MSTNDKDTYSFSQMSEDEFEDMLPDDYDPMTDACSLLWPVMEGVFAMELAELIMQKNKLEG